MISSRRIVALSFFLLLSVAGCESPPQTPPESPSSVPSADGVSIAYEVQGAGEPALVFVHGWSCDRSYWDAQVAYFSPELTVVTVDLGGHGGSGLEREAWTMAAFGQDVAAVVDRLGLQQVVLVGHSMGGPVVVEAAGLLGDRVVGVVGVDTFNDLRVRYSPEEVEAFVQPLRADFSGALRQIVRGSMFVPASDSTLIEEIVMDMSSAPPAVGVGAVEEMVAWFNSDSEEAIRELQAPLRLINSDYNPTDVEAGKEIASSFDAVFMSGVGHFVMMEDPETFNRILGELIQEFTN